MSRTSSLAGPFQLARGEVQCWRASLEVPPELSARLLATLSSDERDRSARFRFEPDQRRFIAAHGVLRDVLGRHLRTEPGRIRYVYNASRKPDLDPEFGSGLKFNLSHSASLALIAIAAGSDVGVDLETIRVHPDRAEIADYAEIARCFFSAAEVDQLIDLPEHLLAKAFISCWTKKEAYLKACGDGLATPLNGFSVPLALETAHSPVGVRIPSGDIAPPKLWSFHTLRPAPGYIGALAIEGSGWRLSQWQWR